jgi:hypothetical protein
METRRIHAANRGDLPSSEPPYLHNYQQFPEAPLLADGWTDKTAVASVIIGFPCWFARWTSDASMFSLISFWEKLVAESQDKIWCFFCLVCGFCNEAFSPESSILSLADAARGIISTARNLRAHAGDLLHSIPEEDNANPPIMNIPFSAYTLPPPPGLSPATGRHLLAAPLQHR